MFNNVGFMVSKYDCTMTPSSPLSLDLGDSNGFSNNNDDSYLNSSIDEKNSHDYNKNKFNNDFVPKLLIKQENNESIGNNGTKLKFENNENNDLYILDKNTSPQNERRVEENSIFDPEILNHEGIILNSTKTLLITNQNVNNLNENNSNSISLDAISKDSISKESLTDDTLSKDSIIEESLNRDSIVRNSSNSNSKTNSNLSKFENREFSTINNSYPDVVELDRNICYCICMGEFDIIEGTVVRNKFPESALIPKERSLEDLSIPDGAHTYDSDTSYLFFQLDESEHWKQLGTNEDIYSENLNDVNSHSFFESNSNVEYRVNNTFDNIEKKNLKDRLSIQSIESNDSSHSIHSIQSVQSALSTPRSNISTPVHQSPSIRGSFRSNLHQRTSSIGSHSRSPGSFDSIKRNSGSFRQSSSLISPKNSSSTGKFRTLYALVQYQVKLDPNVKRGAIQKSLILFSYFPLFSLYEKICQIGLNHILEKGESPDEVLRTIYYSLREDILRHDLAVKIWNHSLPVKIPKSGVEQEDRFSTGKLIDLCSIFGKDIIILWYAMLLQKRIMIVGSPAKRVGESILVLPLLISPLKGFTRYMSPYICLSDLTIDLLQSKTFIVGSTNQLMETNPSWWDICGSFNKSKILFSNNGEKIKLRKADTDFIKNILGGIREGRSEQWVCDQFEAFTKNVLESIRNNKLKQKPFDIIKKTTAFKQWDIEFSKQSTLTVLSPSELMFEIEESDDLPLLDRIKKIFELSKQLTTLPQIEDICANGGIEIVTSWLHDSNSQVRKYSAQILSQLLLSVNGQKSLLEDENGLNSIISLMDDSMPNVRIASYYCLMKLTSLNQGRNVVYNYNLLDKIMDGVSDKVNDIKVYCILILKELLESYNRIDEDTTSTNTSIALSPNNYNSNRIELTKPNHERIEQFLKILKNSADSNLQSSLISILDTWNINLKGCVNINPSHFKILNLFVNATTDQARISSSRKILSQISLARSNAVIFTIEMIEYEGLIDKLFIHERSSYPLDLKVLNSQLILKLLKLSNHSCQEILRRSNEYQIRYWINFVIKHQKNDNYTKNIIKIVKLLIQMGDTSILNAFCIAKGVHALTHFVERQYKKQEMDELVQLCIATLNVIILKFEEQENWKIESSSIYEPISKLKLFPFHIDEGQKDRVQLIQNWIMDL